MVLDEGSILDVAEWARWTPNALLSPSPVDSGSIPASNLDVQTNVGVVMKNCENPNCALNQNSPGDLGNLGVPN